MDKTLQTTAWNCLPREFREEVKYEYSRIALKASKDEYDLGFMHAHEGMFGIHNLTSDAEGEEMLMVSRNDVMAHYRDAQEDKEEYHPASDNPCNNMYQRAVGRRQMLRRLFGSKCMPDAPSSVPRTKSDVLSLEPKPAKPKLKVGDIASYVCSPTLKHKCTVTKVMQNEHSGKWEYNVMFEWGKPGMWIPESDLEPYTEQKEDLNPSKSTELKSKEIDKQFDNILKGGFRDHNRLHVASIIMAGLLASDKDKHPVRRALELADGLIAEAEGGDAK